ncbi:MULTISPECIES: NUDIX hydrolase [Silvimonas]|uniref:NUDIX hydrolase n=1 Tax=Silvimonas TaxID=300264 RepID=UPI0024B342A3|nr:MULTISPECIES: NUDIX domain-containing protein [Silvimonas]MDR3426550.1 NUDIX domain-containing protein [Silvimonas sp.]
MNWRISAGTAEQMQRRFTRAMLRLLVDFLVARPVTLMSALPATTSQPIYVVTLAVIRHQQLLCVRKRGTTRFMLPGGKPESGETAVACVSREVQEELGCLVLTDTLHYVGEFASAAANESGRLVQAQVYNGEIVGDIQLAAEIEEYRWLPLNGPWPVPMAPLLQEQVLLALQQV